MMLAMTGEAISGAEAAQWGLAAEALPASAVLPRALHLARKIAAMPAARILSIKQVMRSGQDLPLGGGLEMERLAYWMSFGTPEQKEGMAAFLEKRPARFNTGASL
jgi:enoyl-CoA hydratase/carnithine racemase